ncbi:nodulation protein NfeD [Salinibacillus xinjiangensis]|uniref:Nodulation protein NfeD n=2 Tax=Salinibacillus xinjiangensis TaxID=1229268 RepID=A0A6G1X725_9BACI|nr:nodulation protein NfeD [Salinibacillus xinjiangensis]
MMLLIGEFLVKLRGVSGALGFGFLFLYFATYLSPANLLIASAFYLLAIALLIIDGKILNDGTLSVIGVILMLFIVGSVTSSWLTGLYGVIGVILGIMCSFLFLKVFPKRNMWDKITLFDRLTKEAGYNSMNESYQELIHQKGIAVTDLRPTGTIKIGEREYSAISNGKWVGSGEKIVVTHADGTKIMVDVVEG